MLTVRLRLGWAQKPQEITSAVFHAFYWANQDTGSPQIQRREVSSPLTERNGMEFGLIFNLPHSSYE